MSFWYDFSAVLAGSVGLYAALEPKELLLNLIAGCALGIVCWCAAPAWARLWNKNWHLGLWQHSLCAAGALLVAGLVLLIVSVRYSADAARGSIQIWEWQINRDRNWQARTFDLAYSLLVAQGKIDPAAYPPPDAGGTRIPLTDRVARLTFAETYAEAACRHFVQNRPFLSRIIWANSRLPEGLIVEDVNSWFRKTGSDYSIAQAVSLASSQIRASLDAQAPRIVYLSRLVLLGLILVVQSVQFGAIGYAAYHDLKVVF